MLVVCVILLHRWWACSQDVINLKDFEEKVVRMLKRVDSHGSAEAFTLLSEAAIGEDGSEGSTDETAPQHNRLKVHEGSRRGVYSGGGGGMGSTSHVHCDEALVKIRSLIEFQEEVMRHTQNYSDAQKYINERPEVLINSLMAHIQYLFGISTLQGVIPRMNEVYLFTEEMSNFMSNVRQMLHMKSMPDATVLTEIYGRIKITQAGTEKSKERNIGNSKGTRNLSSRAI